MANKYRQQLIFLATIVQLIDMQNIYIKKYKLIYI